MKNKVLLIGIILIFFNFISVFATEKFSDVPKTHWAYESIIKLSDKGIVNGYPDGIFLPDAPVSRGEFCKMLSISGGLISDVNKVLKNENWAYPYFVAMKENTWNYGEWYLTEFDADITINRGEVATGICDVYKGYPVSLVGSEAEVKATLEMTYKDYLEIGSFSEVVYVMTINNLMNGYEDRCFHTERKVTRAEMCAILDRAFFQNSYSYFDNDFDFYENTQIPTYTSVTGITVKDMLNTDNVIMYTYDFNSDEEFLSYMKSLWSQGWTDVEAENNIYDESVVIFPLVRGNEFVYLAVDFKINEVYVMYAYN